MHLHAIGLGLFCVISSKCIVTRCMLDVWPTHTLKITTRQINRESQNLPRGILFVVFRELIKGVCITCKVSQHCSVKIRLSQTSTMFMSIDRLNDCEADKINKAHLLFKSIALFNFISASWRFQNQCFGPQAFPLPGEAATANTDLVANGKAPFVRVPQMLLFLRNDKQFCGQLLWCWFLKQIKHGNSRGKKSKMSFLFNMGSWME